MDPYPVLCARCQLGKCADKIALPTHHQQRSVLQQGGIRSRPPGRSKQCSRISGLSEDPAAQSAIRAGRRNNRQMQREQNAASGERSAGDPKAPTPLDAERGQHSFRCSACPACRPAAQPRLGSDLGPLLRNCKKLKVSNDRRSFDSAAPSGGSFVTGGALIIDGGWVTLVARPWR